MIKIMMQILSLLKFKYMYDASCKSQTDFYLDQLTLWGMARWGLNLCTVTVTRSVQLSLACVQSRSIPHILIRSSKIIDTWSET